MVGKPFLYTGRGMHGRNVPVEDPFLLDHFWPLLYMHQGLAQGLCGVVFVDSDAPEHDVGIDQALAVKEGDTMGLSMVTILYKIFMELRLTEEKKSLHVLTLSLFGFRREA